MEIKVGEIGKALRFPLQTSAGAALPLDLAASAEVHYRHMGAVTTKALAFESPRSTGVVYLTLASDDFTLAGVYDLEVDITWNTGEHTITKDFSLKVKKGIA